LTEQYFRLLIQHCVHVIQVCSSRGDDIARWCVCDCVTVQPVTASAISASYKALESATKTSARSVSV